MALGLDRLCHTDVTGVSGNPAQAWGKRKDTGMTQDTILANATLVLPDETFRGQVRLSDGRIADIAPGAAVPAGAVDCGGDLVMPA